MFKCLPVLNDFSKLSPKGDSIWWQFMYGINE